LNYNIGLIILGSHSQLVWVLSWCYVYNKTYDEYKYPFGKTFCDISHTQLSPFGIRLFSFGISPSQSLYAYQSVPNIPSYTLRQYPISQSVFFGS
jgi:hypothetical protein